MQDPLKTVINDFVKIICCKCQTKGDQLDAGATEEDQYVLLKRFGVQHVYALRSIDGHLSCLLRCD
jgi:hypothetical protein